jgi:hypothetical protein
LPSDFNCWEICLVSSTRNNDVIPLSLLTTMIFSRMSTFARLLRCDAATLSWKLKNRKHGQFKARVAKTRIKINLINLAAAWTDAGCKRNPVIPGDQGLMTE